MEICTRQVIEKTFLSIQKSIIKELKNLDNLCVFKKDIWKHKEWGGGVTCAAQKGAIIEKGGINFSAVGGLLSGEIQKTIRVEGEHFYATGISIVLHPCNPFMPIIHMNIRYFETEKNMYWFGGGIDLTPHYVNIQEAHYFHIQLKKICDVYHTDFYDKFKKWADDYFFIKHRNQTRGIGGIFFDRLNQKTTGLEKNVLFAFVKQVAEQFLPIYFHLAKENKDTSYSQKHIEWQNYRRSKYVEFNLIYDKGTQFGLQTGGRTESIFISMPPFASWVYDYQTIKNSDEERTMKYLKKAIPWVDFTD